MIFTVKDKLGEYYYINPANIVYIKERRSYGLWKIMLISGEAIHTKDEATIKMILEFLEQQQ